MIALKNGDHTIIEFDCGCKIHQKRDDDKTTEYREWCGGSINKCIRVRHKPQDILIFRNGLHKIIDI